MATQMLNSADVSLRAESRLTERSQTTIPAAIRDALHLKPGESIHYTLLAGGKVLMSKRKKNRTIQLFHSSWLFWKTT